MKPGRSISPGMDPDTWLSIGRVSWNYLLPSSAILLRKAIAYFLPGLHDVDFECIERGLKFLAEGKPDGQVDLIAGLCLIP